MGDVKASKQRRESPSCYLVLAGSLIFGNRYHAGRSNESISKRSADAKLALSGAEVMSFASAYPPVIIVKLKQTEYEKPEDLEPFVKQYLLVSSSGTLLPLASLMVRLFLRYEIFCKLYELDRSRVVAELEARPSKSTL